MKHLHRRGTVRLVVVAALAVVAFVIWSASASAQPQQPPFLLYGEGEPGDIVTVYDAEGSELGMAVVMPDSSWFVNVNCDGDKVQTLSFQVNGEPAEADINQTGADQATVTLNAASVAEGAHDDEMMDDEMSEDGEMMEEGDSMMEEDDSMMEQDGEMMEEGDSMMEQDGEMMEEEETMSDDEQTENGYPESGSGGLAASGPSTSALIGTIAVLGALALGLGVYRVRRGRSRA